MTDERGYAFLFLSLIHSCTWRHFGGSVGVSLRSASQQTSLLEQWHSSAWGDPLQAVHPRVLFSGKLRANSGWGVEPVEDSW